ncbi:hypothetical protein BD309DRAFT_966784 [Dichomitus squalens]|nr:hypothetical protein BD309DRAFT_966784 [Dichomitus squalens]
MPILSMPHIYKMWSSFSVFGFSMKRYRRSACRPLVGGESIKRRAKESTTSGGPSKPGSLQSGVPQESKFVSIPYPPFTNHLIMSTFAYPEPGSQNLHMQSLSLLAHPLCMTLPLSPHTFGINVTSSPCSPIRAFFMLKLSSHSSLGTVLLRTLPCATT